METYDASRLARTLMNQHGLGHWIFEFSRAERINGDCSHHHQRIRLSRHYVQLNSEELVRDTILHEIAHALVGPGHGHDHAWKRKCVEIGARPVRCKDAAEINTVPARWIGTCPNCGTESHMLRLTEKAKRSACKRCCQRLNFGRFDSRFLFRWRSNMAGS